MAASVGNLQASRATQTRNAGAQRSPFTEVLFVAEIGPMAYSERPIKLWFVRTVTSPCDFKTSFRDILASDKVRGQFVLLLVGIATAVRFDVEIKVFSPTLSFLTRCEITLHWGLYVLIDNCYQTELKDAENQVCQFKSQEVREFQAISHLDLLALRRCCMQGEAASPACI